MLLNEIESVNLFDNRNYIYGCIRTVSVNVCFSYMCERHATEKDPGYHKLKGYL